MSSDTELSRIGSHELDVHRMYVWICVVMVGVCVGKVGTSSRETPVVKCMDMQHVRSDNCQRTCS